MQTKAEELLFMPQEEEETTGVREKGSNWGKKQLKYQPQYKIRIKLPARIYCNFKLVNF